MKEYQFHIATCENPVAWFIFYRDDGEFYKMTFSQEEADKCRLMAYYVHPVYKENK